MDALNRRSKSDKQHQGETSGSQTHTEHSGIIGKHVLAGVLIVRVAFECGTV